jgi:acetyltransferase EpsM
MTPRPLILIGGGEHACVVADAASSTGQWEIVAVVDPAPAAEALTIRLQVVRLADDDALRERLGSSDSPTRPWLVVAVGAVVDGRLRQQVAGRYDQERWASVVHATAWVSPSAVIEPGAVVMAGAVVNAGARVGAHAIINTGAIVEHDVVVGAFTRVGPGATIGGGTIIGDDVLLGLGAAVRDHIMVGDGATVGMGAVVTSAVAPGDTVAGVPARVLSRTTQERVVR